MCVYFIFHCDICNTVLCVCTLASLVMYLSLSLSNCVVVIDFERCRARPLATPKGNNLHTEVSITEGSYIPRRQIPSM